MGTPHSVCRTFARFDFILVPLPAARITAKIGELSDMYPHHSYRSSTRRSTRSSAGAAGFEPAIPGPKPGALPLGHAPVPAPPRDAAIIPERLLGVRDCFKNS